MKAAALWPKNEGIVVVPHNRFERWSRLAVALLLDPERGPS